MSCAGSVGATMPRPVRVPRLRRAQPSRSTIPAEAFHEASRLYPSIAPERLDVLASSRSDGSSLAPRRDRPHTRAPGRDRAPPPCPSRIRLGEAIERRRSAAAEAAAADPPPRARDAARLLVCRSGANANGDAAAGALSGRALSARALRPRAGRRRARAGRLPLQPLPAPALPARAGRSAAPSVRRLSTRASPMPLRRSSW